MRVTYHPDAQAELLEAGRFYSGRVPGLGERFSREFDTSIAAITADPARGQIVEGDIRRFVMRRFPYGIYYRILDAELRILAIKHHSRHWDYWKYRLE